MKNFRFKKYINDLRVMNTLQQRVLRDVITENDSIKHVSMSLENRGVITCAHCRKNKVILFGKRNDLQRYKCKSCNKTFNSLTGTPLARLRKKGRWLDYSKCLVNGFTIREASSLCSIGIVTSFRWRHRFLNNSKELLPDAISGIVEGCEIYLPKSEKGSRDLKRKPRKRGYKASKQNFRGDSVCVFFARDRNSNTYDKIFAKFNSTNLSTAINNLLSKDSLFCSDKKSVYKNFTKENSIRHGFINISKGETVKKDIVHIRNVSLYHEKLEMWMERFNGVATKYLENYLSWYRELDESQMKTSPLTVLLRAKTLTNNPYHPLTITELSLIT